MDLERVLAELRDERDRIDAAIVSLERLDRPGKAGLRDRLDLAAKNHTSGANGNHRTANQLPGGE
jgi:hypothetical protein